jgi:vacuolar-type H+-ATPase subunit I/STV1
MARGSKVIDLQAELLALQKRITEALATEKRANRGDDDDESVVNVATSSGESDFRSDESSDEEPREQTEEEEEEKKVSEPGSEFGFDTNRKRFRKRSRIRLGTIRKRRGRRARGCAKR